MPEVRTDLIVTMKPKGFAEAQQKISAAAKEALKVSSEQVKGFASAGRGASMVGKEVDRLKKRMEDLVRAQTSAIKAMEGMDDKASPAFADLNKTLETTVSEIAKIDGAVRNLERTFQAKRRSFSQGFLQGAVPGAFIERGPGMYRQAAGVAAGRAGRGVAGGLAGIPFGGAQSVVQAVSAIPGIGGALAAPLSRAMQQSEMFLQSEQVRMGTMPFLGGFGLSAQAGRAGRRGFAGGGLPDAVKAQMRMEGEGKARQAALKNTQEILQFRAESKARAALEKMNPTINRGALLTSMEESNMQGMQGSPFERKVFAEEMRKARVHSGARVKAADSAARNKAAAAARNQIMRRSLGNIQGLGVQLMGAAAPEARQFAAGVSQAGGGFGVQMQQQDLLRQAMGAKTLFGVQGETAGAFLQAGRRGGLVGGQGRAGDAFRKTLGDAMRLGLEGSEINTYLQEMAAGITQWRQTGIPVNADSVASMGKEFGRLGVGGVRGAALAGGFGRAAEQMAAGGPQTAGQLMAFRALGGLRGRSMEDMEEAQIRLEEKKFTGEDITNLISQLVQAGGGGASGRRVAFGELKGMGVQISRRELKDISTAIETGEPTEAAAKVAAQQRRGSQLAGITEAPGGLAGAAAGLVPAAVKRQAALQNQQIATGRQMIKAVQTMEKTAQRITKQIADVTRPLLEAVAGNIDNLVGALEANTIARKNEAPMMGGT